MNKPLFMVSVELFTDRLMTLARRRGLPLRETDNGYLVHTMLVELFGELAPKPFAIQNSRHRLLRTLGYTDSPLQAMRERADAFAYPMVHSACAWDQLAAKTMPREWVKNRRFGFEVRLCPVVRRASTGPRGERAGREMDAFLTRIEKDPEGHLTRETVYVEWLRAALDRDCGAQLEEAKMTAFSLRRFIRRNHKRVPHQVPARRQTNQSASGRPDATIKGVLRVAHSESFGHFLRRGIGRHRAFGFGMVLLHPIV